MESTDSFRVRLRFRLQKKLNLDLERQALSVGGQAVMLSPQLPEVPIRDSHWLVMNAHGFQGEPEAWEFAHRLKLACEIASVAIRLGVDTGTDIATSGFGQVVKDHILRQTGTILRDNVHGIDVFPDQENVCFPHVDGTLTALVKPEPFLSLVGELTPSTRDVSTRCRDVLLLLNYALMRPEPVAQIVFAFSAVEMLGQEQDWTPRQRELLAKLAAVARTETCMRSDERDEVAAAIDRGLHRIGLRQGVLRLLSTLGLQDLRGDWDHQYSERSRLVHGLAPVPGADYSQLAHNVLNICGRILLTYVSQEVPLVRDHIDTYFPRNS